MKILSNLFVVFSLLVIHTIALPSGVKSKDLDEGADKNIKKFNYASIQSQIVATSLLKDSIDIDGNHIYSPLGITTILGILAEGARGDTYQEFVKSLGYPADKNELRESFSRVLANFQDQLVDFTDISPTFKTWFYVYRNNTIRQEFRKTLKDFYKVEVKDIDELEFNWNKPDTATVTPSGATVIVQADDVISLLPEKFSIIESVSPVNSKDILEFEDLKKSEPFDQPDESVRSSNDDGGGGEDLINKEASKFDSVVDDKQYVEVPVILAEIAKETELKKKQQQQEKPAILNGDDNNINIILLEEINKDNTGLEQETDEDNETIKDDEKLEELRKDIQEKNQMKIDIKEPSKIVESLNTNEPEKITIPIQKLDDIEIMEAVESRYFKQKLTSQPRTLLQKDDIASALSANSITGRDQPSKTKMLLFNGLYFRGNWAYPFQELRRKSSVNMKELFYVTPETTIKVDMMRTRGIFRTANLQSLDSEAIEFPYENEQFSFVVIIPNEKDGLRKLINTIQPVDIQLLDSRFVDTEAAICLPKFEVQETSRSESTLKKLGIQKVFSRYSADLGDLSDDDNDLHVEEIVQHVNLRVDEGAATKNSLAAANPSVPILAISRSDTVIPEDNERSITVNRPFLYFVLDKKCNFVIAAGKISAPEIKEEFGLDDN